MAEPDPLREELATTAANLLTDGRCEEIVRRILDGPAGVWQAVSFCCEGLLKPTDPAAAVIAREADDFFVMHLPWPDLEPDDPYRMILFVHESDLWSTIALYNRATLKDA